MNNSTNKNKLIIDDTIYETQLTKKYLNRKTYIAPDPSAVCAFIPGTVVEVFVREGDMINREDKLYILEAMKMKNLIKSSRSGKIKKVHIKSGDKVIKNQLIIEFEK